MKQPFACWVEQQHHIALKLNSTAKDYNLVNLEVVLMPFHVYVIRLRAEALKEGAVGRANPQHIPFKPCVYVGSSWHSPEDRYQRHIDPCSRVGSKWVRRFHIGLHKRLTELQPTYSTRIEAEKAERELARRLRKRGYAVIQG